MRLQRLAQVRQRLDEDRRLAGPRQTERAFDAQEIAQVEVLRQRPALLADLLLADHHLDLAALHLAGFLVLAERRRPVPQIDPVYLPADPAQDDPPGDADLRPLVVWHTGGELQHV